MWVVDGILELNMVLRGRYVDSKQGSWPKVSQVLGKDIHETYSPTTRLSTIRLIVSLSVQKGSKIRQMDIKTAYIKAPIAEEIYMKQPEGFEQLDNKEKPLVCLMNKSLYGLKQSGRNWYLTFRNFLVAKGFESSVHDNCLFIKKSETTSGRSLFVGRRYNKL